MITTPAELHAEIDEARRELRAAYGPEMIDDMSPEESTPASLMARLNRISEALDVIAPDAA